MTSREQIRSFISDTFFVDEFADGDSFLKNGIIDSMGMLELVVFLEKTFGIAIVDVELMPENLDSVDNLAGFIERKRAVAA